ncbi:MAG TPA: hypothetical protein VG755_37405 [Nannocystaceae bacterium]|nr:hypothetical protein [Nannocystaceae bacterium]
MLLQWLSRPLAAPLDELAAKGGDVGRVDLVATLADADDEQLRTIARDAGLRWAGYRVLIGAATIDAELERVLVSPQPAGSRLRNRPGDVFELVVHRKMHDAGLATVKALADATGYSRRALDGWLRGHRSVTAPALARIVTALTYDDDARRRESFGLALRLAAAVQELQLRCELDPLHVRRMIAIARSAQTRLGGSRRDALALLLQGSASPLAIDEPWPSRIAMGCTIATVERSSVAR